MEIVDKVRDGKEAMQPDVAVLDCQLPGMSGPQVAVEIKQRGWPARVLALSSYSDDRYVWEMMEAGAVGYMLKNEAPEVIVEAVRAAVRGEGYFSPPVAEKVAAWEQGELPAGLTKREMEVLRLVAEGLSNKEIAQALKVTAWTVGFHVSNILKKLGIESRVEAAV